MVVSENEIVGFESDTDMLEKLKSRSVKLRRFMPFERFYDLVLSDLDSLSHPMMWDDPFESVFCNALELEPGKFNIPYLYVETHMQSWTHGDESDAMWRIYSPNRNGVMVTASVDDLLSILPTKRSSKIPVQNYLGLVKYVSEAQFESALSDGKVIRALLDNHAGAIMGMNPLYFVPLLMKRQAFEHEREVRVIIAKLRDEPEGMLFSENQDSKKFVSKVLARVQRLDCEIMNNFYARLPEVTLDPRVDDATAARFEGMLRRIGFKGDVRRSTLYREYRVPRFSGLT